MTNFVFLSTADWDHPLWTNKQHTAVSLASLGHRILYVESLGLRPPRKGGSDLPRIFKRLFHGLQWPRQVKQNIWVWSPLVIPGASSPVPKFINKLTLTIGLYLVRYLLRFRESILWSYNPLAFDFVSRSSFRASIYHCVDRLQAQPEMPSERIDLAEKKFCRAVEVVFTTSPELQCSLSSLNSNTYFFGNVADFNHFSRAWRCPSICPEKLRNIPAPRLIFIGAIDAYKVDLEALLELAKKCPEWNIVLAGPVGEADPRTNIKQLQDCSNVFLVGSIPYEELPDWLSHADVALLPLLMNVYTKNMFPMKFFEYLAAGIPVVASAIPSLIPFSNAALLVEPDEDDLEKAINLALSGHGPSQPERLSLAYRHTYIQRTKSMLNILEDCGLI